MAKIPLFPFLDQGYEFIIFSIVCLDLSSIILIGNIVWERLFIRLTARVCRGRWTNFVRVLLSLSVLRVGCRMYCINS